MESFEEKKPAYTHENPCPLCGYPVAVSEHNPDWCENAREDNLGTEETEWKAPTDEEFLARVAEFTKQIEESERLEKEAAAKAQLKPKEKKSKKLAEKKEEIPEKLKEVVIILADKIKRKVGMAAGGFEAKEVKGEYQRNWIKVFLPRIIKEQEESRNMRVPGEWVIILRELELCVIDSAKEFVKKYREEYEQKLRNAGIL